jgi:hypothetical protein
MGELVYVSAPSLCQGADEEVLLSMSEIIAPGLLDRETGKNGLRIRVSGNYKDQCTLKLAADEFQLLLGIIRAWNPIAGERRDEVRPGIGTGSIRDENGNQVVICGTAIWYRATNEEIDAFSKQASIAINRSLAIRNALWLNGRRNRNAADFYMIYEYAETIFEGEKNIASELNLSVSDFSKLRRSANNLCPLEGGRHAKNTVDPGWGLEEQKEFTALMLRKWITYLANQQL